jgi:SAM-dependent methyltransferase
MKTIKMPSEQITLLDQEILDLFAQKGIQIGGGIVPKSNGNGVKVRRVMQLIKDYSNKPFDQLSILDLACGEGVYAIEAALRGAQVLALDARPERMNEGAKAAKHLGINNLSFKLDDIRRVHTKSYSKVDVVLLLGILYHLDEHVVFSVLENIYELCNQFVIIDTHIALNGLVSIQHNNRSYTGKYYREHADNDTVVVKENRLLSSLDNPLSFWFTKESLFHLLNNVGFTSVCECNVPFEPFKPNDRITLIAFKGESVKISTYPWVNDKTEDEIEYILGEKIPISTNRNGKFYPKVKKFIKSLVENVLRKFRFKKRHINSSQKTI